MNRYGIFLKRLNAEYFKRCIICYFLCKKGGGNFKITYKNMLIFNIKQLSLPMGGMGQKEHRKE